MGSPVGCSRVVARMLPLGGVGSIENSTVEGSLDPDPKSGNEGGEAATASPPPPAARVVLVKTRELLELIGKAASEADDGVGWNAGKGTKTWLVALVDSTSAIGLAISTPAAEEFVERPGRTRGRVDVTTVKGSIVFVAGRLLGATVVSYSSSSNGNVGLVANTGAAVATELPEKSNSETFADGVLRTGRATRFSGFPEFWKARPPVTSSRGGKSRRPSFAPGNG